MIAIFFNILALLGDLGEQYPGGKGVRFALESQGFRGQIVNSFTSNDYYNLNHHLQYRAMFCPPATGTYKFKFQVNGWATPLCKASLLMKFRIDDIEYSKSIVANDVHIFDSVYLYKGKCYPMYLDRNNNNDNYISHTAKVIFNGDEYDSDNYGQEYTTNEVCSVPFSGPKRTGYYCQNYTNIFCNGRGEETYGTKINVGEEKCVCTAGGSYSNAFCEPTNYVPFQYNSGKIKQLMAEKWDDSQIDPSSQVIPFTGQFLAPDIPYKKVIYEGYIYLAQIGDYSFKVTGEIPVYIDIDTLAPSNPIGFADCHTETKTYTQEVRYTNKNQKAVVKFRISAYTACSILDRHIKVQWINHRDRYVNGITNMDYSDIPTKYITDDANSFVPSA